MIRPMFRAIAALLLAIGAAASPASAQQPTPPDVPLWRLEPNGDAVQTGLGFVLPPRIGPFERVGFTANGADGDSVMTHYRSTDGRVALRILIQGRGDVDGVAVPGAEGVARNWEEMERAGDAELGYQPAEVVIEGPLNWGTGDRPNAMMRLSRHSPPGGPQYQGLWYRNFGIWAVLVIASGPEAQSRDVEGAGVAAMMLPWPRAPLSAELRAMAPHWLPALPECTDYDRSGSGRPVDPGDAIPAMLGLGLGVTFLDTARNIPHPAHQPDAYCRIETFRIGEQEVIALGWRGDTNGYPAARYAFMRADGGMLFQYESFFSIESAPPGQRQGIRRLVWLSAGDERRVAALRVFTHWPSYEDAKAIVVESFGAVPAGIVEVTHPAAGLTINMDPARPR